MRKNGFTLVEAIIAMAVGALIMAAVYGYMSLVQKNSANADRKIVTLQDTRTVLDLMATEIRMASYLPPPCNMSTWLTIPACPEMAGWGGAPDRRYKGIQVADANKIFVAMDLNGDAVIGPPGASEYIMYYYDGASTLYRDVSCGGNQAILGGTALSSNIRNAATGVNLFRYFDRANNEITATVSNNPSTVNGIPAIRRILITIVADTADKDLNTQQYKRIVYSTSVMVRNHGFTF
jgi:prepilin-type N-terminal cleavage/methylation domain-containing protein